MCGKGGLQCMSCSVTYSSCGGGGGGGTSTSSSSSSKSDGSGVVVAVGTFDRHYEEGTPEQQHSLGKTKPSQTLCVESACAPVFAVHVPDRS